MIYSILHFTHSQITPILQSTHTIEPYDHSGQFPYTHSTHSHYPSPNTIYPILLSYLHTIILHTLHSIHSTESIHSLQSTDPGDCIGAYRVGIWDRGEWGLSTQHIYSHTLSFSHIHTLQSCSLHDSQDWSGGWGWCEGSVDTPWDFHSEACGDTPRRYNIPFLSRTISSNLTVLTKGSLNWSSFQNNS